MLLRYKIFEILYPQWYDDMVYYTKEERKVSS